MELGGGTIHNLHVFTLRGTLALLAQRWRSLRSTWRRATWSAMRAFGCGTRLSGLLRTPR